MERTGGNHLIEQHAHALSFTKSERTSSSNCQASVRSDEWRQVSTATQQSRVTPLERLTPVWCSVLRKWRVSPDLR